MMSTIARVRKEPRKMMYCASIEPPAFTRPYCIKSNSFDLSQNSATVLMAMMKPSTAMRIYLT